MTPIVLTVYLVLFGYVLEIDMNYRVSNSFRYPKTGDFNTKEYLETNNKWQALLLEHKTLLEHILDLFISD